MYNSIRRAAVENLPTLAPLAARAWRLAIAITRTGLRVAGCAGIALAALLAAALVVHGALSLVWGRQLDRKLAELRSRGLPVAAEDLRAARVRGDKSAAAAYGRALRAMRTLPPTRTADPSASLLLDDVDPSKKEALLPIAQELVLMNAETLRLTEQAALLGKCEFEANYGLIGEQGPPLFRLNSLTRLVSVRAVLRAHEGSVDLALADVILALRLSDAPTNSPTPDTHRASTSRIKMALGALREITRHSPLTSDQAARMHEALASLPPQPDLRHVLANETALAGARYDFVSRDWEHLICVTWSEGSEPSFFDTLPHRLTHFAWRPFLYKEQRILLDLMERNRRVVNLPYRELRRLHPDLDSYCLPSYTILTGLCDLSVHPLTGCRDDAKARIGLACAAMALEAHRHTRGSYPDSLVSLQTLPGWKLPGDPFSGRPFGYRRTERGFVLYSCGMNLKDDKGKISRQAGPVMGPEDGDIVWACER